MVVSDFRLLATAAEGVGNPNEWARDRDRDRECLLGLAFSAVCLRLSTTHN